MTCLHVTRQSRWAGWLVVLGMIAFVPLASAQPAAPVEEEVQALARLEVLLDDAAVRATLSKAQWAAYSDRIEEALASGHDGLCEGGLRMIIRYGDDLSIDRRGVFDVVRLYRDHDHPRLRRMAVVALGAIQDPWSMDFLTRSLAFEQSVPLRHTIRAVLIAYKVPALGPAKIGS